MLEREGKKQKEKKSRFTDKMDSGSRKKEHWSDSLKSGGSGSSSGSSGGISKTTHSFSATKGRLTEARKIAENKSRGGLFKKSMRQFQGSMYKHMSKK